jgi:hypothetical protein
MPITLPAGEPEAEKWRPVRVRRLLDLLLAAGSKSDGRGSWPSTGAARPASRSRPDSSSTLRASRSSTPTTA